LPVKLSLGSKILNIIDFIIGLMEQNKREKCMSTVIRVAILSWSAALLTASYAGLLAKMDPTFIATVFTASAATFGINTMKKGGDDDEKKEPPTSAPALVEAPPEPPAPETEAAPSLEERVEVLEGQVQPRTGGA
jgi:Domain of unknown function (DUF6450)